MSSPRRPNDSPAQEAHPDPPSPTHDPAAPATAPSPSSSSSAGVGDVGSTSGRGRFYDALRRIGFPHLPPSASEPAGPAQAAAGAQPSSGPAAVAADAGPSATSLFLPATTPTGASTAPSPSSGGPEAESPAHGASPPDGAAAEQRPPPAPDDPSVPRAGQPFFGLDIILDANGGPPPTREEMEILMRSLFGPSVTLPAQPMGPTLSGGQQGIPTIQAIPPPGMFTGLSAPGPAAPPSDTSSAPASASDPPPPPPPSAADFDSGSQPGAPLATSPAGVPPTPVATPASNPSGGAAPAAEGPAAAATDGAGRPPAPGGLGQLINHFIANLVQQHRTATANSGAPPLGSMPVIITFSFGSPGQMAAGLNNEKVPDPERANELLGALSRPSTELIERLDHALRCEEDDAGVEEMERTGAQCSVCMDTLVAEAAASDELEEVVSLPCGHVFHVPCLRPWLETNTNCPTCRFDLDPLSTTLRPHRRTPGRAPAASNPADTGAIPSATGANAQGRGHPYSRPASRPSTPTTTTATNASRAAAPPAAEEKKYVLPTGRQTLLERVIHLEKAHHIRCSLPLCSHADPDLPSPARHTIALVQATQPGPQGFVLLGCEHRFHPDCLRIACRVRGDRDIVDEDGRRLVGCDIKGCRGEGWVERDDWEGSDAGDEDKMDDAVPAAAVEVSGSAMEVDAA